MSMKSQLLLRKIADGEIRKIAVLTGAGISCASGIPDFRSPGGMYSTLRPELLTATEDQKRILKYNPTAVVDFEMFRVNQFPYLEVRRPFILGSAEKTWKPTLCHFMLKVLEERRVLRRLYTQNIDGLDYFIGMKDENIVPVHGSISKVECEFCQQSMPLEEFCGLLKSNIRNIYDPMDPEAPEESKNIFCPKCNRAGMKPRTVMYGRSLPKRSFECMKADFPDEVDLLLVIGTSLATSPMNQLVSMVDDATPRVVINRDPVGEEFGMDYASESSRDYLLRGDCDQGAWDFLHGIGWAADLLPYQDLMCEASQKFLAERRCEL